jgi:hypothetical protein
MADAHELLRGGDPGGVESGVLHHRVQLRRGRVGAGDEQRHGYSAQEWHTRTNFPAAEISDGWRRGFHITSLSHGASYWALVLSKGTGYTEQEWRTRTNFPSAQIRDGWDRGFFITSLTRGAGEWALVMSKGTGYSEQAWRTSTDFPPSDFASLRASGYEVTGLSHGAGVWALVMSRGGSVETPSPVSTTAFPSGAINAAWQRGEFVTGLAYGNDAGPKLTINRSDGQITLEWSGIGVLEQRNAVDGPGIWTVVAGSPNPLIIPALAGSTLFRVRD